MCESTSRNILHTGYTPECYVFTAAVSLWIYVAAQLTGSLFNTLPSTLQHPSTNTPSPLPDHVVMPRPQGELPKEPHRGVRSGAAPIRRPSQQRVPAPAGPRQWGEGLPRAQNHGGPGGDNHHNHSGTASHCLLLALFLGRLLEAATPHLRSVVFLLLLLLRAE